jgi:uncharacterized membrane protein YagU involved in acid resistance
MAEQAEATMEASRSTYRASAGARVAAGIAAGLVGGILMIGFMMVYADRTGAGATTPLKALGGLVYGVEAMIAGPPAIAAGVGIQLGFSILIGILFAICMSRATSTTAALFVGIMVGVAIWAAMYWYILPLENPTMAARTALIPQAYFIAHVMFGAGLATTPAFLRAFSRERRSRDPMPARRILPTVP